MLDATGHVNRAMTYQWHQMPRLRARVDAVQAGCVKALLGAGCRVQSLAALGKGVPDALVSNPWGELFLLEFKSEDGKLGEHQETWHQHWSRCTRAGTLHIVRTPEEALIAVGVKRP